MGEGYNTFTRVEKRQQVHIKVPGKGNRHTLAVIPWDGWDKWEDIGEQTPSGNNEDFKYMSWN